MKSWTILFAVLLLTACTQERRDQPLEQVSVAVVKEYALLIGVAQEQGFFAQNGLNVTAIEFSSGATALAAMLNGTVQLGTGSEFVAVRNSFKDEDYKILASLTQTTETFKLIGRRDHGIYQANDLKGKTVGVTQGAMGEFFLGKFLLFHGLTLQDITLVDFPPAELEKRLADGSLDAIVTFEPYAHASITALGDNAFVYLVQQDQDLNTLLYTREDFLMKRPDLVREFVRSLTQAEAYVKEDDTRAVQYAKTSLGYDDTYIDSVFVKLRYDFSLPQKLLLAMEDEARWALSNNITTGSVPNYLEFMAVEPLKTVNPKAVSVIT